MGLCPKLPYVWDCPRFTDEGRYDQNRRIGTVPEKKLLSGALRPHTPAYRQAGPGRFDQRKVALRDLEAPFSKLQGC